LDKNGNRFEMEALPLKMLWMENLTFQVPFKKSNHCGPSQCTENSHSGLAMWFDFYL